jgi:hypothetical protein
MRSGVLAMDRTLFGTRSLTSAAMLFSEADGILVGPPAGAPGSSAAADIVDVQRGQCSNCSITPLVAC